jgi:hypothetical protein
MAVRLPPALPKAGIPWRERRSFAAGHSECPGKPFHSAPPPLGAGQRRLSRGAFPLHSAYEDGWISARRCTSRLRTSIRAHHALPIG